MVRNSIEPFEHIEKTAFKERQQIIDKLNEVIDVVNQGVTIEIPEIAVTFSDAETFFGEITESQAAAIRAATVVKLTWETTAELGGSSGSATVPILMNTTEDTFKGMFAAGVWASGQPEIWAIAGRLGDHLGVNGIRTPEISGGVSITHLGRFEMATITHFDGQIDISVFEELLTNKMFSFEIFKEPNDIDESVTILSATVKSDSSLIEGDFVTGSFIEGDTTPRIWHVKINPNSLDPTKADIIGRAFDYDDKIESIEGEIGDTETAGSLRYNEQHIAITVTATGTTTYSGSTTERQNQLLRLCKFPLEITMTGSHDYKFIVDTYFIEDDEIRFEIPLINDGDGTRSNYVFVIMLNSTSSNIDVSKHNYTVPLTERVEGAPEIAGLKINNINYNLPAPGSGGGYWKTPESAAELMNALNNDKLTILSFKCYGSSNVQSWATAPTSASLQSENYELFKESFKGNGYNTVSFTRIPKLSNLYGSFVYFRRVSSTSYFITISVFNGGGCYTGGQTELTESNLENYIILNNSLIWITE